MKLSTLSNVLLFAPLAVSLAQTPQPAAPVPKPVAVPAAPKPAPMFEDIPGADPVVLSIGDDRITKSQFERILSGLPEQVRARANAPGGKRQIAEQVAQLKSLSQEARKRGIDKTVETRELIAFQTDSVLANTLYREIATGIKADDAAAQKYYEDHKKDYDQVTARHILIRFKGSPVALRTGEKDLTEEEALAKIQDLRKRILAGEDFAKLAQAESDDAQSGKDGGSLGSFGHGRMVPAFEEAAFKQPVGEVGEPIKSQFGYHIIKVEKHDAQSFESVKSSIEQKMKPELAQKAVDEIRKKAAVTMNESYFGK